MFGYIYKTIDKTNGKLYIGQNRGDIVPSYYGSGTIIKRELKRKGTHSFKLEIIAYADSNEQLNELEKKYISEYRKVFGTHNLYNINDGGNTPWNLGKKWSEETKRKIGLKSRGRKTFLGRNHSIEARRKISESKIGKPSWNKGKSFSAESRQKMSESHKGWIPSDEWRHKRSEYMKGQKLCLGKTPWNKGIPRTEECKCKISETKKRKNYERLFNSN